MSFFLYVASDAKKMNLSLGLLPCILPPGRKGKKRASIDESFASYIDVKTGMKFVISGQHVFAICVSTYLRE